MNDDKKMEIPPAVSYASKLLLKMHDTGQRELTVRRSQPLPEVDDPPEGVEFPDLIKKLKIMSSLQPEPCDESVDGTIGLNIKGNPHTAATHFEDQADDPFCRITLTSAMCRKILCRCFERRPSKATAV